MDLLIGQYSVRLTDKGRLALPKKFREKLGERIIVAKWYEGCLVVVGSEKWSELLGRLTGKTDHVTQSVRDTDRFILGSAFEVDLDGQGRFVVPKNLKEYAKVKSDAVFVGLGDRVEIWDEEAWSKREVYIQENAAGLIENIAKDEKRKIS
jgi:MraZ protein